LGRDSYICHGLDRPIGNALIVPPAQGGVQGIVPGPKRAARGASLLGVCEKSSEPFEPSVLEGCHGGERFGEVAGNLGKGEFAVDAKCQDVGLIGSQLVEEVPDSGGFDQAKNSLFDILGICLFEIGRVGSY